jgi:hypothetical protein
MAIRPKLSATAHYALGLRGPATEPNDLARHDPRRAELAHRSMHTPALGSHRAHDDGGARTQSGLRGTSHDKVFTAST